MTHQPHNHVTRKLLQGTAQRGGATNSISEETPRRNKMAMKIKTNVRDVDRSDCECVLSASYNWRRKSMYFR